MSLSSLRAASTLTLGLTLSLSTGCVGSKSTPAESPGTDGASTPESASAPAKELPSAINAGSTPSESLVDDLEDGDHRTVVADQRGGYWYTYADKTSTIEPAEPFTLAEGGAGDSKYAARMHGTIGTEQYPYAGLGFSLAEPKAPYDLSQCTGISFQAKKGSSESTSLLRFKVGDINTVPEGGVCKDCFNDFGSDVFLTEEWTEFSTAFKDMKQEPYWGEPQPAIDASRVYQLQWQVKDRAPFDIWIDDVKLVGCGSAATE